jgi:ATP-dependent Clp protease ATP-binding subunit ClpC
MNQSFFIWYYLDGSVAAFKLLFAFLKAWWNKGNVWDLFTSLIAPWHRDITSKNWTGLHPMLWMNQLLMNVFSCFMGALVRFFTIIFVFIATAFFFFLGLFLILIFLTGPFLVLLSFVFMAMQSIFSLVLLFCGLAGIGLAAFAYFHREKVLVRDGDPLSYREGPLFLPVAKRLGATGEEQDELKSIATQEALIQWLQKKGLEEKDFTRALAIEKHFFEKRRAKEQFWSPSELAKWLRIWKSWKYGYTIHLDKYSDDLTLWDYSEYRYHELYGKEKTVELLLNALERNSQNSVLLVGNPGIGKQSIIHYIAKLIRENGLRGTLFDDMRILWFDIARVVSDADARGEEVEESLRQLLTEATLAGNCILAIPHFERILLADNKGRNFRPLIEEFLGYPNLRIIGLTDTAGKLQLDQDAGQALGLLDVIEMTEPNPEETLLIILSDFHAREQQEGVITLEALDAIIQNSENVHWETPFPERAIDMTEDILVTKGGGPGSLITKEMVESYFASKTGIPKGTITEEDKDMLLHLEERLHARIVGQEQAVSQIAEALRKARAGFSNNKRPIGSFLFLGPTGVGKTETAKALAHVYFGNEEKMIRLDMSEFQTPEAVDRLIGSAAQGTFGVLTSAVAQSPYSILLLDELEKAYPRALDLFLQILDEGFVTDGYGQKINFRNCIIIATSNAGSVLQKQLHENGTEQSELERQVIDSIVETGVYRLEFLNRFDGVVFFLPLANDEMLSVVQIKLEALAQRLYEEKNIHLSFEPGVAEALVQKGYDPIFGARSLNRFISDTLEDQIAKALIDGSVTKGGTLIIRKDSLPV